MRAALRSYSSDREEEEKERKTLFLHHRHTPTLSQGSRGVYLNPTGNGEEEEEAEIRAGPGWNKKRRRDLWKYEKGEKKLCARTKVRKGSGKPRRILGHVAFAAFAVNVRGIFRRRRFLSLLFLNMKMATYR